VAHLCACQGDALGPHPNVEIYDMPRWMGDHVPPLRPQPGLTLAPYVYASGVPETAEPVVHYPLTADGQPVLLLHRATLAEPFFSRALAGFEPWLLERASHERLAEYILVRHMRLGGTLK
jgi:hypothetical protein